MNLTKGHNNLTKLNEIISCICGWFCNEKQHMALDRNFHIIEELYYIFVFSELNTPDVKYHIREDHSNST